MTRGIFLPNFSFLPFSVRPRRPPEKYRGEIAERSRAEAEAIGAKEFFRDPRRKRPRKTAGVDGGQGKPLEGVGGFE